MTTLDHTVDEAEVVKSLEQRGLHGLDSLSLEELEVLAERKRKQLHQEAVEKKAHLESEIASIGQQIQELQAKKGELEAQLKAVAKSLGGSSNGGERAAKRAPRKPSKPAETETPSAPEE